MIDDDFDAEHNVAYKLQHAAIHFAIAWAKNNHRFSEIGRTGLREAAALLGYDLVPIQTAQESHDAAIARRVAEDGPPPVTSAPGFDGRACHDDPEWSR